MIRCYYHKWRWGAVLSTLADGELESSKKTRVLSHLNSCKTCRSLLEDLTYSKSLLQHAREPIELDNGRQLESVGLWREAVAALLFLFLGVSHFWISGSSEYRRASSSFLEPLNLSLFLEDLQKHPTASVSLFDQLYEPVTVNKEEARHVATFAAYCPLKLPSGYLLERVDVLKVSCCRALRLKYGNGLDRIFVFEQPPKHPIYFHPSSGRNVEISGVRALQIKTDGYGIWNFESGGSNVTIIGQFSGIEAAEFIRLFSFNPKGGKS